MSSVYYYYYYYYYYYAPSSVSKETSYTYIKLCVVSWNLRIVIYYLNKYLLHNVVSNV